MSIIVPVDLLCNDPRNGLFTGRVEALNVGPNMSLQSTRFEWGPRLRYLSNETPLAGIAIARKHFPIVGYKYGAGNWCWDRVLMKDAHATELLNWLRPKGWFDLDEAEERLFNWWQCGKAFTKDDARLLAKDFGR